MTCCPRLDIDAWLDLAEVTTGFARQVEALEPFGMGNPTPVFAASDVLVQQCCRRGQDGSHLSLSLRTQPRRRAPSPPSGSATASCCERLHPGDRVDVAFTVGLNCWQGITSAQLVVKDIMT